MVYLPTQPNAPGGHSRLTIGLRPPEVMGPPAVPVPHPQAPPTPPPVADRSLVKPNRRLATAAVNPAMANRTQTLANRPTPQPSAAPPSLQATGKESLNEARAKLTAWTLAGDVGNVIRQAFWGSHDDAATALASLKGHARRMLGNSFAGGMIVGAAEEAQHMIGTGKDPRNLCVMAVILAAQAVPAIAAPLDITLALIGGATAMKAFANSCHSLQEGNTYDAGVNLSKTLLNLSLGKVAKAEGMHAHQTMTEGKLVSDRAKAVIEAVGSLKENPTALKTALIGVMEQVKANNVTLKAVLRSERHGPSPAMKGAHLAETTGKLNANQPVDHGHDHTTKPPGHAPHGKPAAHH